MTMSGLRFSYEVAQKRAKKTFRHYMELAMRAESVELTGDNYAELDSIVEDVIEASTKLALSIWIDKAREFQKYLIRVGCSCSAEKLVDEWMEEDIKPSSKRDDQRPPVVLDLSKLACRDCGNCMDFVAPNGWNCPECGLELKLQSNHPEY